MSSIHVISCQVVQFRPANEIQPEIALQFEFCIPWHSVHQAQQDLFATAAPADSFFAPGLGWGHRRGGLLSTGRPAGAGAAGAGAGSSAGSACGVHLRMGLLGSAR